MKEKEIELRLKRAVDQAPLLNIKTLAAEPCPELTRQDPITLQQETKPRHLSNSVILSVAAAAAACLILFFAVWFLQYRTEDSVIFLEADPSIEIVTNKKDQVIALRSQNPEAEQMLSAVHYQGKSVEQVVDALADVLILQGYLQDGQPIALLVQHKKIGTAQDMQQEIEAVLKARISKEQITPYILSYAVSTDDPLLTQAQSAGVSAGKMKLIQEASAADSRFSQNVLKSLSTAELISVIDGSWNRPIPDPDNSEADPTPLPTPAVPTPPVSTQSPEGQSPSAPPSPTPSTAPADRRSGGEAEAALKKQAPGYRIIKMQLEADNGRYLYEVELHNGTQEIDGKIDAFTAETLEWKTEYDDIDAALIRQPAVGISIAAAAVLRNYPGSTLTELKLKEDDDILIYKIKFLYGDAERELALRASNGEPLYDF